MKTKLLLKIKIFVSACILILLISSLSCTDDIVQSSNDGLNGEWQWIKTEGGFAPHVIVPEPGTSLIISFQYNRNFILFRNDSIKVTAKYDEADYENNWNKKITFKNINTFNYSFEFDSVFVKIDSDTLTIWDGMFDGFFSYYLKKY